MLTTQELSSFRSQLIMRKKEIRAQLEVNDHFGFESNLTETQELSSYDNHPGDLGTALYEREKDFALNEHEKLEIKNINEALEAIKVGMYGICAKCSEEIPFERLEALPTSRYCISHTPDNELSTDRPIEEEVLSPPFAQFDMDEKSESVGFDSEDSWQEVARYGTSNSPSDFENPPGEYENTYLEYEENVGYVEDYENFVGMDMDGHTVTVYPNKQHERYEDDLDDEGIMTTFGDLPPFEHESYTEEALERGE